MDLPNEVITKSSRYDNLAYKLSRRKEEWAAVMAVVVSGNYVTLAAWWVWACMRAGRGRWVEDVRR